MNYYFPCKPNNLPLESDLFDTLNNDVKWIAEPKRNGHRALFYSDDKNLWTRYKTLVKDELPEIRRQLATLPEGIVLDGELINHRPKNWTQHLYIFDIIAYQGKLVNEIPLEGRRKLLESVYKQYLGWCDKIEIPQWTSIGKKKLYYDSIGNELLEGIVMKRLDSKYLISLNSCLQNPYWIKVKKQDKMFESTGD